MAKIQKQVTGVVHQFRVYDKSGKLTRTIPAKTDPQTGDPITPPGTPPEAVQVAVYSYDDGSRETWRHDPSQASSPARGWVQEGSATFPDDETAKTLRAQFKVKQEEADKEEVKRKTEQQPKLLGEATTSDRYRTIQRRDPTTGEIALESVEDPSYQKNQADSGALEKNRAAIEASRAGVEASRASTARSEVETRRLGREEQERGANKGLTAAESANNLIARRQQEWREYTDQIKQDFDNRKINFDQAQAKLGAEHNRLSLLIQADQNKIAQRGQDITARGQSLDFAERMGQIGVAMLPYMSDPGVSADIDRSLKHLANPRGPAPEYQGATGVLNGMSPRDFVNAALQGISPAAGPAPPGGFVAPPTVPGQVEGTQIPGLGAMGPMPSYGAAAAIAPPGPMAGVGPITAPPPQVAGMVKPDDYMRRAA